VAKEIVHKNLLKIMTLVENDYTTLPNRKFSTDLVFAIKHLIGECLYEVSEGLMNGLDDY
jgi:hypothetical protein